MWSPEQTVKAPPQFLPSGFHLGCVGSCLEAGPGGDALVMGRSVWLPESMAVDKQMFQLALSGVYSQDMQCPIAGCPCVALFPGPE